MVHILQQMVTTKWLSGRIDRLVVIPIWLLTKKYMALLQYCNTYFQILSAACLRIKGIVLYGIIKKVDPQDNGISNRKPTSRILSRGPYQLFIS